MLKSNLFGKIRTETINILLSVLHASDELMLKHITSRWLRE